MKNILSLGLAAIMIAMCAASCAPARPEQSDSSSADGIAKYTAYLEEHLDEMPDSLVVATAEDSAAYGVDMTAFADDGYFTRAEAGEVVILGKSDAGLDRAVRDYVKNGNENDYFKVYNEGYRVKKLTVAGNDISEYAVVRDDDADECQTFAASELVTYIEKTCGAVVPSYTASEYASASDKPARAIRLTVDYPALGDEAFTINVGDDANITISGGRYRGCMYGVYDLLEDIGWRFLGDPVGTRPASKPEAVAYKNPNAAIDYLYESEHIDLTSEINRTEAPSIAYRQIQDADTMSYNVGNLGVKSKSNGLLGAAVSAKTGSYGLTGVAIHGLQRNHDAIFSGEYAGYYNGCTMNSGHQPCFTDDVILEAIDVFVVKHVKSRLEAGQQIGRELVTVDLSQWDTGESAFCTCQSCLDVFKEEGCTMGAVLRMGNRAASLLTENGYGGVNIALLAYSGTNKPPKKTEPLDNVRISYCIYVGNNKIACSNHTVSGVDCDPKQRFTNSVFGEELEGWSKICHNDNLDVWYYVMNAYNYAFPSPYFDVIRQDIPYLKEVGTNGIMFLCNDLDGAHLDSMALYLGAKLAWDSTITKEEYYAYMLEYLQIVYGDAGENIYEYIIMCEKAAEMAGCWSAFHSRTYNKVDNEYMAENFDYMYELFEEAKTLADTEHQEFLVELYEAGMLYVCLGLTHTDRYLNGTEEQRAVFAERYEYMYELFTKYRLLTFDDYVLIEYAPEELDLEANPFTWSDWENTEDWLASQG